MGSLDRSLCVVTFSHNIIILLLLNNGCGFFLDFEVFTLYYYVLVFSTWLNTLFIVLDKKNGKKKRKTHIK